MSDWKLHPFEPHRIARLRPVAYMKNVVTKYLDMLVAWGDQLFARATIESINEATQLYIIALRILGKRPTKLPATPAAERAFAELGTLDDAFSNAVLAIENLLPLVNDAMVPVDGADPFGDGKGMYFCIPPNPELLSYWDTVEDRLYKIRHCLSLQGAALELPLFEPPLDPGALVKARAAGVDIGSILADVTAPPPLVRFGVLSQRANELVAEVKVLGAALLSALEKRDAEDLALLRSNQEAQLVRAIRVSKQNAVEEAQRSLDGLNKSLEAAQIRQKFYGSRSFMNDSETQQVTAITEAASLHRSIGALKAEAGVMEKIPQICVGTSGMGGHSTAEIGGILFAGALNFAADVVGFEAARIEMEGELARLQGTYERRQDDWNHQLELAGKDIEQITQQIEAAKLRRTIAETDLASHDLQIENATDVRDFLRDKFTNVELYDWMLGQIAAVYFQAYKLAYDAARRAERAWQFELADSSSSFISFGYWDGLRKGLLAGEKLALDLKRMEMAYLDKNTREYELTRHIPLTELNPYALQKLRETGECTISVPEAYFDVDSPGHFLRRIKHVTVTVAGASGPYTPVRCTLTLLSSSVRAKAEPGDDNLVSSRVAVQSIVTSSAKDDGGLFETNLRDERYLPFEGAGVVSQWQLRLPSNVSTSLPDGVIFPAFDYRTISEVVLHMRHTAREGGTVFRDQVVATFDPAAADPPLVWAMGVSVKSVFSDAWTAFTQLSGSQTLTLPLDSAHLPFRTTQGGTVKIRSLRLVRVESAPSGTGSTTISVTTPANATQPTVPFARTDEIHHQYTGEATYSSPGADLGDWKIQTTVSTLWGEGVEDLFLVIMYEVPGV